MYDRQLIEYLPHVLRDVLEYKALNLAEDFEISELWAVFDKAFKDQFINSATEYGVSRWENILGIVPKANASLSSRKALILSRLNERLPFTIRRLRALLDELCGPDGYIMELRHNEYYLKVHVELKVKDTFDDVTALLHRVVPANIVLDLSLKYNTHAILSPYRHMDLQQYTHDNLRIEVLNNGN